MSNVTNLEVSRWLARTWPPEDGHAGWWLRSTKGGPIEYHEGTCDKEVLGNSDGLGAPVAARDLSELEAEMRRMGLEASLGTYLCNGAEPYYVGVGLRKSATPGHKGFKLFAQSGSIIDALGAAVAEAKEKKCKPRR